MEKDQFRFSSLSAIHQLQSWERKVLDQLSPSVYQEVNKGLETRPTLNIGWIKSHCIRDCRWLSPWWTSYNWMSGDTAALTADTPHTSQLENIWPWLLNRKQWKQCLNWLRTNWARIRRVFTNKYHNEQADCLSWLLLSIKMILFIELF